MFVDPRRFARLQTKKLYRTTRLVGAHAYTIAAAGAAARAARAMEDDCLVLREEVQKESSRAPWMPTVSKGAKMVLEQWLCALAQEAGQNAHAVREATGDAQRLNRKHMQLGWDAVFESVFSSSAIMPRSLYAPAIDKPKKKKGGKSAGKSQDAEAGDEDYSPPDDEADGA